MRSSNQSATDKTKTLGRPKKAEDFRNTSSSRSSFMAYRTRFPEGIRQDLTNRYMIALCKSSEKRRTP